MNNLQKQTVYLPFKGGSIYGKGVIKKKDANDPNIHNFIFENERGKIYFNSFEDRQIKGVEIIFTPKQLNEYTQSVIKQALETAAERALCDFDEGGCTEFVDEKSITNTFEETFKKFKV